MTTLTAPAPTEMADETLALAIERACARIAPAWPLDRMIAVNPYWGWTDRPITQASADLGGLVGAPMLMPRAWYRAQWEAGLLTDAHLQRALEETQARVTLADLREAITRDANTLPHHPLVTDVRDALRNPAREHTWNDFVLGQIGRAGEAFFDVGQAAWGPDRSAGLFALWRALARTDTAPRVILGQRGVPEAIDELPETPEAVIAEGLSTLAIPRGQRESYLTALLMNVGGWAAACAHRRWDARLAQSDDHSIVDLLAIRLAWELVLYRTAAGTDVPARWTRARRAWQERAARVEDEQQAEWVLQRAIELRYHDRLAHALAAVPPSLPFRFGPAAPATVRTQAVFCIDVRSEVFRRSLEDEWSDVRTLGFAGFFGLPIAYAPLVGDPRPQLPGLLAAAVLATDGDDTQRQDLASREAMRREATSAWRRVATGAPSAFSYVEATGIAGGLSMLRASFAPTERRQDPLRAGLDEPGQRCAPRLTTRADGTPLDVAGQAALAAGALRGMSLTEGFARLVAFVGHAAAVTNNPQQAGLACGACGGQSGEVNARALAGLLNDRAVREQLAEQGIIIPEQTRFIAGVHDTTSDDVTLYVDIELDAAHAEDLAEFRAALARAGRRARRERAVALGLPSSDDRLLGELVRERGADWSEVRPEWGLARNAAFIAAPRSRTRPLHLSGRSFLHEYDWTLDGGFKVLETILTAPVVVAHWINMQYYASTVDPERFGSGDKTLHNVVGGSVGLFEGAGGDLRIGLAKQSVHDGKDWVHEPLRLGVFVEAPAAGIDGILEAHANVRGLVEGEWIFLYRIDPDDRGVYQRKADGWTLVAAGPASF